MIVVTSFVLLAGCGGDSYPSAQFTEITLPAEAPDSIRQWDECLNSTDPLQRAHGVRQLGLAGDGQQYVIEALLDRLQDGNCLVRAAAAESLGQVGDEQSAGPLIEILRDKSEDREVRARAAEALGRLKSPAAVEPLISALDDIVWRVRYQAVIALGKIGDPAARDAVAKAAEYDPDRTARAAAQEALKSLE
jgi:HEAT repeat protein